MREQPRMAEDGRLWTPGSVDFFPHHQRAGVFQTLQLHPPVGYRDRDPQRDQTCTVLTFDPSIAYWQVHCVTEPRWSIYTNFHPPWHVDTIV